MEGGKEVQAGAAWVAGLGQALIVISLTAGARVARWTEAVEGARGVEAGTTVFTGTGTLLGWEERRAGSSQGPGMGRAKSPDCQERCGAHLRQTRPTGERACVFRIEEDQEDNPWGLGG